MRAVLVVAFVAATWLGSTGSVGPATSTVRHPLSPSTMAKGGAGDTGRRYRPTARAPRRARVGLWERVHRCEGDPWTLEAATYSGGLGIANGNWAPAGGLRFGVNPGDATPAQQAEVAATINRGHGVPDAWGCGPW